MGDITPYLIYITAIVTLGPLQYGYHLVSNTIPFHVPTQFSNCYAQAELNAPEKAIRCLYHPDDTFAFTNPRTCIPMDTPTFAIVTSIFTLGGLIGALSAGPLSTAYGRLPPLRLASIFFLLGPVLSALAPNIGFLVTGRFLSGVGSGAALVIVPIYIGEIAPMASKGSFGALTQITINVGILLAQVLGFFMNYDAMWRVVLAVAGLLAVVQAVGLLVVVESPKWLASKEKVAVGRRILQRIRGGTDIEPEVAHWGNGGDDEGEILASCTLVLDGRRHVLPFRGD